jgi:hypothetical protein
VADTVTLAVTLKVAEPADAVWFDGCDVIEMIGSAAVTAALADE